MEVYNRNMKNSKRPGTPPIPLIITSIFLSLPLLFVTGCISPGPFSQSYRDYVGTSITNLPPWSGQTVVFTTSDLQHDIHNLLRKNFCAIGESAFRSAGETTEDMLRAQAKNVGADVVLYRVDYLGSEQSARPVLQYLPGQTYTTTSSGSANANVYGSGGYAFGTGNYYGTTTTTTPGTFYTQVVPVTLHHYNYDALYFRRLRPLLLGLLVGPLSDELRAKLQRNTGAIVQVVVEDSPAFRANILEGDLITKIAGEEIASPQEFNTSILKHIGQRTEFEVWRDGETKIIPVQIDSLSQPAQSAGK